MKKVYGFIFAIAVMLLITGCTMKTEYLLDISKDGNIAAKITIAYDDEMIDGMLNMGGSATVDEEDEEVEVTEGEAVETTTTETETHTDAERWAYVDSQVNTEAYKDYKKEKYEKDGFKGYTLTIELGKLEDHVGTKEEVEKAEYDELTKTTKIFVKEGNTYKLNMKGSDAEEIEEADSYAKMGAIFDVKFSVKLPNKAKSNNATKVEGTTYTWDLMKAQNIELEFELGNNMLPIIIGCACAAVVVIGVVVCIVVKGKKKKAAPAPEQPQA